MLRIHNESYQASKFKYWFHLANLGNLTEKPRYLNLSNEIYCIEIYRTKPHWNLIITSLKISKYHILNLSNIEYWSQILEVN